MSKVDTRGTLEGTFPEERKDANEPVSARVAATRPTGGTSGGGRKGPTRGPRIEARLEEDRITE